MQTSLFFMAIAALARIALATPPACLIAALGVQTNPADIPTLCKSGMDDFYGNITEKCNGDNKASAEAIYSSTCLANGVTITLPTTTSKTSSPTGTGSSASSSNTDSSNTDGTDGTDGTGPAKVDALATGTEGAPTATQTSAGSSLSAHAGIILGSTVVLCGFATQLLL